MRTVRALAVLVAGALFMAGYAGNTSPEPNVVKMTSGMKYEPSSITITAGETIHWKNASIMPHTVTADPALAKKAMAVSLPTGVQPFNSGTLGLGKTFDYTFTVPGTYKYFCIPHESKGMVGEVIVRPAP